ncbi:MAG: AsnC family transcriptional regulator [Sulfolobales archaeon]|nr:AsnC family transcriptional regulator [Sulfolobales archaeon]MCX8208969.1 AsnC family transcriptional regulator [Sulfolobales archaeon]MDW8010690.1 AsnC family transcriptional regulator [Sulfolobales archaeon]
MLDDKDRAILALLSKNARITISSIASLIKMSDVATKKRLVKLESKGVILGYRPIVNPRELGYEAIAFIGLNTEPGRVVEVAEVLSNRRDTTFVAIASGDHEVIAELWARNTKELLQKIKDLEKISGVKEICPAIIVNVVKQYTSIPEEFITESSERESASS